MNYVYVPKLTDPQEEQLLYALLAQEEGKFVPPLSQRSSTTQQSLSHFITGGVEAYFNKMKTQHFILAKEDGVLAGFMSFLTEYENPHLPTGEKLYASTCVVHPDHRGKGIMTSFYREMMRLFPTRPIYTRTWHENFGHLRVLEKLGFSLLETILDDRGEGIHTVYWGLVPVK